MTIGEMRTNTTKKNPKKRQTAEEREIARKATMISFTKGDNFKKIERKIGPFKAFHRVGNPKPYTGVVKEKASLRAYQDKISDEVCKDGVSGMIVAAGTGVGKTLIAVATASKMIERYPDLKVIVCVPKSLVDNFRKEMVCYGLDPNDEHFYIDTPYAVSNTYTQDRSWIGKERVLLIMDEAHNYRTTPDYRSPNMSAKLLYIASHCFKVLAMTATPMVNDEEDMYNLLAMTNNEVSVTSFDTFPTKISQYYPAETSSFYPKIHEHDVLITMDDEYYENFMKVERQMHPVWHRGDPVVFYTGLRQATMGLPNSPIIDWTIERLKKNDRLKKRTIVSTQYKGSGIHIVTDKLDALGIKYSIVTGDTKASIRQTMVDDYNAGKVSVLLITAAGGEGLDTRLTNEVIIMGSVWNRATNLQTIGRAARFKSHYELPKEDQRVDVYFTILTKPDKGERSLMSPDLFLKMKEIKKQIDIDARTKWLATKDVNIDHLQFVKPPKAYDLVQKDNKDLLTFEDLKGLM